MKKKIIIVNNNMQIGGIQKALTNLLNVVGDQYDFTLFLFDKRGSYLNSIPSSIRVVEAKGLLKYLAMSQDEAKRNVFSYLIRSILVVVTRVMGNPTAINFCMCFYRKIDTYDVAISFMQSATSKVLYGGCNEFVLRKINAKIKIGFLHCDYSKCGINTKYNKLIYQQFDRIAAVSEGCKNSFLSVSPQMKGRVMCVRNFNDYKSIVHKSKVNPVIYDIAHINMVTVSRLSQEKGILRALGCVAELINEGYKIRWHIIGDGKERILIENEISRLRMGNAVFLYGNQENPYRYMVNADFFLLPSYHEAAPMVFDEAKCLGLPILTTDTTSTKEMVEDCNAGWVCENSTEGVQTKLEHILNHLNELEAVKVGLKKQEFSNKQALEQFKCMLGLGRFL